MAAIPPYDPRDSILTITDTGNNISTFSPILTSVDGLPGSRDLLDTSKIGDSGHTFTPSLLNGTFVIEGLYSDDTATANLATRLMGILSMSTSSLFEYAPTGDSTAPAPTNTHQSFTGNCFMRSFTHTGRVNTAITFRAELQVDGVVAIVDSTNVS